MEPQSYPPHVNACGQSYNNSCFSPNFFPLPWRSSSQYLFGTQIPPGWIFSLMDCQSNCTCSQRPDWATLVRASATGKLICIRDRRPLLPVARSKRRSGPRARVRYHHLHRQILHHQHSPSDRDNDFQLSLGAFRKNRNKRKWNRRIGGSLLRTMRNEPSRSQDMITNLFPTF